MTTQTKPMTLDQVMDMLANASLSINKDYAFGDGEYMWIDDNNMIIAEAYISSSIADFWTCPPGSWILNSERSEPSWSHGSEYDDSLTVRYTGTLARDLSKIYSQMKVYRNDSGDQW
jgi:hypothetical protein